MGNHARADIADANLFATNLAWLVTMAAMRQVFMLIEQPKGSLLLKFGPFAVARTTASLRVLMTYMGAFAHPMMKPTWLLTNIPSGAASFLIKSRPRTINTGEFHRRVPKRKVPKEGESTMWWQGTKKLKSSEEYTQQYCDAVLCALRRASR